MKILYLITKTELGGAQTHLLSLMKDMVSKGHTVGLMSRSGGWLSDEAQKIGVALYPNDCFSNSWNPVRAYGAVRNVKKAIADFKPDIISCHSSGAGTFGRLAVRGSIPTIFTAHSWAFTDGAPFSRKLAAVIFEKALASYAEKIICVSEFDRKLALKYGIASEEKLITIHNGVPIGQAEQKQPSAGKLKIVSIMRFAYPKEPLVLIEAFSKISESVRQKASLEIIGSGPLEERMSNAIRNFGLKDLVFLQNDISPAEIQRLLSQSDIFILVSKHEGLPMSVLEAMAAGLPVIASAVGGIPEEIDASCGILVEKNRVDLLTNALVELIQNQEMRMTMSVAARKRAATLFALSRFLSETELTYTEALRNDISKAK